MQNLQPDTTVRRQEDIQRLARAVTFYREHPSLLPTRTTMQVLGRRFLVHPRTLATAIELSGLLDRREESKC